MIRKRKFNLRILYDGTFSGRKIEVQGLFAALCIKAGCKVLDIEDLEEYLAG